MEEINEENKEEQKIKAEGKSKIPLPETYGDDHLCFPIIRTKATLSRKFKSKGVDKIITFEKLPENGKPDNFYLVKMENSSYRKCIWLSRSLLQDMATQKLRNFEKILPKSYSEYNNKKEIIPPSYLEIQRILHAKRSSRFLVKWKGLLYDESTWENVKKHFFSLRDSFF